MVSSLKEADQSSPGAGDSQDTQSEMKKLLQLAVQKFGRRLKSAVAYATAGQ